MPHYCWASCINQSEFSDYSAVIEKVITGHALVEKINGHQIYKARINQSDRLFWITTIRDGVAHMEIIEVILNHDYQKSRFLKPGILKQYLEKRTSEKNLPPTNLDSMPCDVAEYLSSARYYDQRFISFTRDQEQALLAQEPVLITGAAGSGKSCVLFAALHKMLDQMSTELITGKILYVAQSPWLVNSLQGMWGDSDSRVLFLSYTDLIKQLDPDCLEINEITSEYFFSWFNEYIKQQERTHFVGKLTMEQLTVLKSDPAAVLQEFRVLAALNPAEYLLLGRRHSLFHENKQVVLDAYTAYQASLPLAAWDPSFYTIKSSQRFYGVAVDEALDLSMLQLLTLYRLAENSRIYYAMDSHQRLLDRLSHRPLLLDLIGRLTPVTHIQFEEIYRCSNAVIKLANALIEIKTLISGGVADRHEVSTLPLSSDPEKEIGSVLWLVPDQQDMDAAHLLCQSVDSAVVTLSEHIPEAQRRYSTPLIFTPEQIKGLDYKTIICWRLLDDLHADQGKYVNNQLSRLDGETASSNRPKSGLADNRAAPYFNRVITAITRATGNLLFVQSESHSLRHITSRLKLSITGSTSAAVRSAQINNSRSTKKEWLDHASLLVRNGKNEQARLIFLNELGQSESDFLEFHSLAVNTLQQPPTSSLRSMNTSVVMVKPLRSVESPTSVTAIDGHHDILSVKDLLANFSVENVIKWLYRPDGVASLAQNGASNELLINNIMLDQQLLAIFVMTLKELEITDSSVDIILQIYKLRFFDGNNIIHLAAINDCTQLIELFYARGFCVHTSNQHGITPLYLTILNEKFDAMDILIKLEADFDNLLYPEFKHWTTNYVAMDYSSKSLLSLMHEPNYTKNMYWTTLPPLFGLAREHGASGVRQLNVLLKDPGYDVNLVIGENNVTALLIAVQHANHAAVSTLIRAGSNVNFYMRNGASALIIAAQFGYEDIIRILLSYGADIDHQSDLGCTALIGAACYGQAGSVKLLLDAHASIDLMVTADGISSSVTALDLAILSKHKDITYLLYLEQECNLILLNLIGDFTPESLLHFMHRDRNHVSFLFKPLGSGISKKIFLDTVLEQPHLRKIFCDFLAAKPKWALVIARLLNSPENFMRINFAAYGCFELMQCLMVHPQSKELVTDSKFLFKAIHEKYLGVLKLIINAGTDLALCLGEKRISTIQLAVETAHLGIVCTLLNSGAKEFIDVENAAGQTPLIVALSLGLELIALALIKAGADVNITDRITGVSTLMLAVSNKLSIKLVNALLDKNVDVYKMTQIGTTALSLACDCVSSHEIINRLKLAVYPFGIEPAADESFQQSLPVHP